MNLFFCLAMCTKNNLKNFNTCFSDEFQTRFIYLNTKKKKTWCEV